MNWLKEIGIDWKTIVVICVILVGAFILNRVVIWLMNRSLDTAADKLKVDRTKFKFFKHFTSVTIWIIAIGAIIYMVPRFKALALTMFAGAGILVAIIGFAAQQAFSNIINGVFIVFSKPYRIGDLIKIRGDLYGVVEDITLRHTIINNFENKRVIIPNAVMGSEVIENATIQDFEVCRWIEVGISYDSNVDLAIKIMQEESLKHPQAIDMRSAEEKKKGILPAVEVRLLSFGDSSVNLRACVWTKDPYNAIKMHSDINYAIKNRFDKEGIEIPFPYRTVVFKKDLPVKTKPKRNG